VSIKLTILGCGSSSGVPRIGNNWGDCDPDEPKNRRSRCALLVEKSGENGCTTVLIDTGPDMRNQLLSAEVTHLDAVLYTHAHADHLHGIDDLRAFLLRTGEKMSVYMDAETYERAEAAFGYCFKTPADSNYPPILAHQLITPGNSIEISGAGGTITFEPISVAHGTINALGYRIENAAYFPDVSDFSDDNLESLKKLDLLILDCLRRRPHPSHFCLDDSLVWTKKIAPKHAVFTNLNDNLDYGSLSAELPEFIVPAFDGMCLKLAEKTENTSLPVYAK
jgi:phosphoribosyl 1,2-cyclic phosphate phosphodiesterase